MPTELDTLLQEMRDIKGFLDAKVAAGIVPLKEELERLGKALLETQSKIQELRKAYAAKVGAEGRIMVPSGRLAGYSPLDLRILENL